MSWLKKLLIIIFSVSIILLFGSSQEVFAVSVNSVGSGNWDVAGTWDVGVPNSGDDITIKNGHTVTITDVRTITGSVAIEPGGVLVIDGTQGGRLILNGGSLSNSGTITIIGGNNIANGTITTVNGGSITNSGTITATGSGGQNSGAISISGGSTFNNFGTMSFTGSSGPSSGRFLNSGSIFTNSGTMTIVGGSGPNSALFSHSINATTINECTGTMSFTGGSEERSGAMGLFGGSTVTNNGIITLTGGTGPTSGSIFIDSETVNNHNTIIQNGGPGPNSGIVLVFTNGVLNEDPIPCPVVGGELLPIDTTALLLAGFQTNLAWIIPVVLAGTGFAAFKLKRK